MAWLQHDYHYVLPFGSHDTSIDEIAPNSDGGIFQVAGGARGHWREGDARALTTTSSAHVPPT